MITNAPLRSPADPTPADAARWAADLQTLLDYLGRHFARCETRTHLRAGLRISPALAAARPFLP